MTRWLRGEWSINRTRCSITSDGVLVTRSPNRDAGYRSLVQHRSRIPSGFNLSFQSTKTTPSDYRTICPRAWRRFFKFLSRQHKHCVVTALPSYAREREVKVRSGRLPNVTQLHASGATRKVLQSLMCQNSLPRLLWHSNAVVRWYSSKRGVQATGIDAITSTRGTSPTLTLDGPSGDGGEG
jgi:hypothetical protein